MPAEKTDPCTMVIFGASGDLTQRKLLPALYNLALTRRLPDHFSVVGYARSDLSQEEFRRKMRDAVGRLSPGELTNDSLGERFFQGLYYVRGGYGEPEGYRRLKEFLSGIDRERPARGQYGRGTIETEVKAYREEPGVARDSTTETYAALKLHIDNWRWQGVPFYLRSGKRLSKKLTEIAIHFKRPPLLLFKACPIGELNPNILVMSIQPNEGICLTFEVKPPGPEICVTSLGLDFNYQTAFRSAPPDAYETLLVDCMRGDSTLFTRHDWIELSWSLMTPLLQGWGAEKPQGFPNYEAGTWGPKEADAFIERDSRRWRSA